MVLLRSTYEQAGYIRVKLDRRIGHRSGWEVRLFVKDLGAVEQLSTALRRIGLEPGAVFRKRGGWILPIYGLEQTKTFLDRVRPGSNAEIPDFPPNADGRRRGSRRGSRLARRR